jgi:hypothetical protein
MFLKELKCDLQSGEFAKNYSFVLQDGAQGFHWNNIQATIHPFVIYIRTLYFMVALGLLAESKILEADTGFVKDDSMAVDGVNEGTIA